jgi:hypothetical protein
VQCSAMRSHTRTTRLIAAPCAAEGDTKHGP